METIDQTIHTPVPPPSKSSHVIKYAVIGGLIAIVFGLIVNMAGLMDPAEPNYVISVINFLILVGTIIMAVKNYYPNPKLAHYPFGNAFGVGALTGLFLALLLMVYMYVYMAFIDPGMVEDIQQAAIQNLERQGVEGEGREMAESWILKMTSPIGMAITQFFSTLIISLIAALIGAAIFKNNTETY